MATKKKKFLLGCGGGCLALLALGIGGCVSLTIWIDRPGELLEPERLLGSDTTGYLEWTLRLEDPGTREFIERMLEVSQEQAERESRDLPSLFRFFTRGQQARNEKQMQELLPLVVAWALRTSPTGEDLHLGTLSIERMGNRMRMFDWVFGIGWGLSRKVEVVRHRGEKIFPMPAGDPPHPTFFIHGSDFFITSHADNARLAVDLLLDSENGGAAPGELERLYAALPERALRGAVINRDGQLARLWRALADLDAPPDPTDEPWSALRAMTLAGGFSGADRFEADLSFLCRDAEWAAAHAEGLAGRLRADYQRGHLLVDVTSRADDEWIRMHLVVDDFSRLLEGIEID